MARLSVSSSADFQRIKALPARVPDWARYERMAESLSLDLLNGRGRRTLSRILSLPAEQKKRELAGWIAKGVPLVLMPEQVFALDEYIRYGVLYLHAPVGTGKTLLSMLLFVIAEHLYGARVGVLLVKGNGRKQTISDLAQLRHAWEYPSQLKVMTYEALSRRESVFSLCGCPACANTPGYVHDGPQLRPDLIVADECHSLNSPRNVVHKRIGRYKRRHPDAGFIGMSGTTQGGDKAMEDAGPLTWALGSGAPVPLAYPTRVTWGLALDRKLRDNSERHDPGVLLTLDDGPAPERDPEHKYAKVVQDARAEAARDMYARRRAATPGCAIITRPSCDQPLSLRITAAADDDDLSAAFRRFREKDIDPDGLPVGTPLARFRIANQLGCGFHTRWREQPEPWWIEARTLWNLFCREVVKKSQRSGKPIDSEGAVMQRYPDAPELGEWRKAKEEFMPTTIAQCVSMSYIREAAALMLDQTPCLVWTPHTWVGDALSRMTGVLYFASQGKTLGGTSIAKYNPEKSAILSTHANRTQRNLQAWSRNVILGAESSAKNSEQMLGRTHRRNQKSRVSVTVLAGCGEHVKAMHEAFDRAENMQRNTSEQKLLAADVAWDMSRTIKTGKTSGPNAWRWRQ